MPVPPEPMPGRRAGRLLKRWHYVGVYGPELMLCAGWARVGPTRQAWWAVWDRWERELHERTRLLFGRNRVVVEPGRVAVDDGVVIDLALDEGASVEVVTPDAGGYAWTRKQGAVPVRGRVRLPRGDIEVEALGIVDESAGYLPRHTSWFWSAGVAGRPGEAPLAWNLVAGVHDSPTASERTVWSPDGVREVGPARFAPDLSAVGTDDGLQLSFFPEAARERDDNLLVLRSKYSQPFGTFSGTLGPGLELTEGFGVMERHEAVW